MYIAKLGNHTVVPGIEIEIQGPTINHRFTVLEVLKNSFQVKWLNGDNAGHIDSMPHSIFAEVGAEIEIIEISDDDHDPNRVWQLKRAEDVN